MVLRRQGAEGQVQGVGGDDGVRARRPVTAAKNGHLGVLAVRSVLGVFVDHAAVGDRVTEVGGDPPDDFNAGVFL